MEWRLRQRYDPVQDLCYAMLSGGPGQARSGQARPGQDSVRARGLSVRCVLAGVQQLIGTARFYSASTFVLHVTAGDCQHVDVLLGAFAGASWPSMAPRCRAALDGARPPPGLPSG